MFVSLKITAVYTGRASQNSIFDRSFSTREVALMSSAPIGRRSLLRNTLAVSGLLGLDSLFTAKRTDAAQVGPKDKIKVTKIDTFVLTNSWVFVKISTDAGITGWGEMLKDDAKACAAGALEVGDYLIGQDPSRVVHHWQAIHRGAFYRGGPIKSAISSGIDMARS